MEKNKKIIKKTNITNKENKMRISVEIDENFWLETQNKITKEASKNIKADGFREGHVPENIAKNYIDQATIFRDAINSILQIIYKTIIEENDIKPFFHPDISVEKLSDTNLTINFDFPVVNLEIDYKNIYKKIDAKYKKPEVSEEEIDKNIDDLIRTQTKYVTKEKKAEKGDKIVFDFEGFIDNKPFEGGKAEKYELVLGSNRFVPGFEDQLINIKAGEKKDVEITFPENYYDELKGKKGIFKCFVHEVKAAEKPILNDENIIKFNICNVKNEKELRKYEKEKILLNKKRNANEEYFNEIIKYVIKFFDKKIPEKFIEKEFDIFKLNISKGNEDEWKKYLNNLKKDENKIKEEIKNSIIVNSFIEKVMKQEKITVTDEDLENEYKEISFYHNLKIDEVKKMVSEHFENFKARILQEKIRDIIIKYNIG